MDAKVGLMVFGVVLLLSAIFLFFKSFASHEHRMQEEQRARIELERKKLEAERDIARRPLTPEETAQRKTDAAKRALVEEQRKEAEKKRLEGRIEAEKQRAEVEKQRAEERRQAEELRAKWAEEAARKAEEERLQAEEAEKARKEKERIQRAETARIDVRNWMESVQQNVATAYAVMVYPPDVWGVGSQRTYGTTPAGQNAAVVQSTYRSPDEVPGFITWDEGMLTAFCRQALSEDANRHEPIVTAPEVFQRIGSIDDPVVLKDLHQKLTAHIYRLQSSGEQAGKNFRAGRNLVAMGLRQLDKLNSSGVPVKPESGEGLRKEKQKTIGRMRTQIVTYWKGMNESRGTAAADKLLAQAKQLVADRFKEVGGEDLGAAATALSSTTGSVVSTPAAAYKIYVLRDGAEIKAYTVMTMGEEYAIKDETGQIRTVKVEDVKEIKKP